MELKAALNKIASRQDLTGEEMRAVMTTIMEGNATPSQIGAFLMGMRVKGETVGEIAAAVSILREKMVPVAAPENVIDIVGTGGDGTETLNISTAAAIVTASAGVPVAKHGNRALSSKSGASDVLTALAPCRTSVRDQRSSSPASGRRAASLPQSSPYLSRTTFCCWTPRPSMPMRIVSPGFRKRCGFMPMPTPGGVPVVMMSPGIRVKNCDR